MGDLDRLSIAQCEGSNDFPHQTIIYVDREHGCPLCQALQRLQILVNSAEFFIKYQEGRRTREPQT